MKALIVGVGSIGRRHIQNLKTIDPEIEIAVLRQHSKLPNVGAVEPLINRIFFKAKEVRDWRPAAVIVSNPASLHVGTAMEFARQGCHLFIEKPLSDSTANVDALIKECKRQDLVLMVGYVLRFFEPLKLMKGMIDQGRIGRILSIRAAVGRYLPHWRPGTDYRNSVSARKELGGGVVFELSHELDYVRWLVGEMKEVSATIAKVSDFKISVEDIAEINVRFKNKAVGNIHLDMLDQAADRSCRVTGTEGTLLWDSNRSHYTGWYSGEKKEWIELLKTDSLDYNQMFIDELRHFLECVRRKQTPLVTGLDGKMAVEIALAAKRSAKIGKVVHL